MLGTLTRSQHVVFFRGVCVGRSYCWKPIASCRALIIPEEIYYLLFFFHGKWSVSVDFLRVLIIPFRWFISNMWRKTCHMVLFWASTPGMLSVEANEVFLKAQTLSLNSGSILSEWTLSIPLKPGVPFVQSKLVLSSIPCEHQLCFCASSRLWHGVV